jgi:hypothetical protein
MCAKQLFIPIRIKNDYCVGFVFGSWPHYMCCLRRLILAALFSFLMQIGITYFTSSCLHSGSDYFRLDQYCRMELAFTGKSPPCYGAHPKQSIVFLECEQVR